MDLRLKIVGVALVALMALSACSQFVRDRVIVVDGREYTISKELTKKAFASPDDPVILVGYVVRAAGQLRRCDGSTEDCARVVREALRQKAEQNSSNESGGSGGDSSGGDSGSGDGGGSDGGGGDSGGDGPA